MEKKWNNENNFLGLVPLDNIRDIIFNQDMYDNVYVRSLMIQPPSTVSLGEPMDSVMKKFRMTGLWNLPILNDGKYMGFVSRSNLFNAYRKLLVDFSED